MLIGYEVVIFSERNVCSPTETRTNASAVRQLNLTHYDKTVCSLRYFVLVLFIRKIFIDSL